MSRRRERTRFSAPLTLDDDTLARLADDCWTDAEEMREPKDSEEAARTAVLAAVEFAAEGHYRHEAARRIMRDLLPSRRLVRRALDPLTDRLHRAIWLMTTRLFETSMYDPALRCTTTCDKPDDAPPSWFCPSVNDPERAACARSLVFPFLHSTSDDRAGHVRYEGNKDKAARAIVRGLKLLKIQQPNGQLFLPTEEAVRKVITRFPARH